MVLVYKVSSGSRKEPFCFCSKGRCLIDYTNSCFPPAAPSCNALWNSTAVDGSGRLSLPPSTEQLSGCSGVSCHSLPCFCTCCIQPQLLLSLSLLSYSTGDPWLSFECRPNSKGFQALQRSRSNNSKEMGVGKEGKCDWKDELNLLLPGLLGFQEDWTGGISNPPVIFIYCF